MSSFFCGNILDTPGVADVRLVKQPPRILQLRCEERAGGLSLEDSGFDFLHHDAKELLWAGDTGEVV